MMDEAPKRFIDDKERQERLREKHAEKYGSIEEGQMGLLKEYDNNPQQAEEVRKKRPIKVMAVCMAGMHRSKLVAEALESEGMGYVASYAGVDEGMSHPMSEQRLREDDPQAIIFATKRDKEKFVQRFSDYYEKEVKEGEVLVRVTGLSDSEVARRLNKDDVEGGSEEADRLKRVVKDRLIEMGFEPLGDSWS